MAREIGGLALVQLFVLSCVVVRKPLRLRRIGKRSSSLLSGLAFLGQ